MTSVHRNLVPALLFLLLVGVTAVIFVWVRQLERGNTEIAFQNASTNRVLALKREYEASIAIVESVGAFFDTESLIAEADFETIVAPLLERNPAIRALSWVPRIADEQRLAFEEQARASHPGFRVTERKRQGVMRPAGRRDEYFPVRFLMPLDTNEAALGFDLASEAVRRAALLEAASSGDVIATAPIVLVQGTEDRHRVLLVRPLYRSDARVVAAGDRNENLTGFVTAIFDAEQLIDSSLRTLTPAGIDFEVLDVTNERDSVLVAEHLSRTRGTSAARATAPATRTRLKSRSLLEVAGRRLQVDLVAAPGHFETPLRLGDWGLLITGLLLSVAIAAFVAVAQRAYARSQLHSTRLEQLSRQLVDTQETERRHLARELHDEIGQDLTALKMNLYGARELTDKARAIGLFDDSNRIVDRIVAQVRNLSLDLRPSMLDDLGLDAALRWYLKRQTARAGLELDYDYRLGVHRLPSPLETASFRLTQEAVANIIRHAGATRVRVSLRRANGELLLDIKDNGMGFDVDAAMADAGRGRSFGLLGMQERVKLAGGVLTIQSQPGVGTQVHARFAL